MNASLKNALSGRKRYALEMRACLKADSQGQAKQYSEAVFEFFAGTRVGVEGILNLLFFLSLFFIFFPLPCLPLSSPFPFFPFFPFPFVRGIQGSSTLI